jgi:hypothetical protein
VCLLVVMSHTFFLSLSLLSNSVSLSINQSINQRGSLPSTINQRVQRERQAPVPTAVPTKLVFNPSHKIHENRWGNLNEMKNPSPNSTVTLTIATSQIATHVQVFRWKRAVLRPAGCWIFIAFKSHTFTTSSHQTSPAVPQLLCLCKLISNSVGRPLHWVGALSSAKVGRLFTIRIYLLWCSAVFGAGIVLVAGAAVFVRPSPHSLTAAAAGEPACNESLSWNSFAY